MSDEIARERLDERAPGGTCAACGSDEWGLVKDGKPITFLSFEAKDDPRIRVLSLACLHCGYLRFHSMEVLLGDG